MFDKPYRFDYLGIKETLVPDPVRIAQYRFKAKHRRYLVSLEVFSYGVVAIKYCDAKDKNATNRFDKIFNDHDAFRVITTCLHIMLDFWKSNLNTSFAFYAIPRKWDDSLVAGKNLSGKQLQKYTERFKKARFNIYKYAMVNLFPPRYFIQLRDTKNSMYVLLNKKQKKPKTSLKRLGNFLAENYEMIFEVDN